MTTEHPCGRIGFQTVTECAERAAEVIASAREKLAVCLSPEGFVTVEAIEHAILTEMVDVYSPDSAFRLWGQIETDLAAAMRERGITGGRGHRHRAEAGGVMDVEACPFCGNADVLVHHGESNITFLLCGDDVGRGGCGAVVSFRPNLIGSRAIAAYNRRTEKASA